MGVALLVMGYRLDLTRPMPDALRAVLAEQLDDALDALTVRHAADPVTAVHEARKDLKKARSALRLARTGIKPKHRRGLNDGLRDVARQLSGTRDADVLVQTIDGLADRYAGQLPRRQFTAVRARFAKEAAATAPVTDTLLDELRGLRAAVDDLRVQRLDLAEGAGIAYARGRETRKAARKHPDTETLHEWRKRVKDRWYHARLLEDAWAPVMRTVAAEAHLLSDHLGDEHDLGVLRERLEAGGFPPSVDTERLLELTDRRRSDLRHAAFALGDLLYAEKTDAFARRLRAYLEAPVRAQGD